MWLAREFPDCPFKGYAADGVIHCKSQSRARQVLGALKRRMAEVGLELHRTRPGMYCKDGTRRGALLPHWRWVTWARQ